MTHSRTPDDVSRIIVLMRGLMEHGGPYWCYVSVKPSRYKEFQQVSANNYNIQNFTKDNFGEVVVSGEGQTPPDEVTKKVAELFGVPQESFFTDADPLATAEKQFQELEKTGK